MNIPPENLHPSAFEPHESQSPLDTLTGSGLGTGLDSGYTDSPPSFSADDREDDNANIAHDNTEAVDNSDDPENLAGNADAHQKGTPNNTTVEMVVEDNFNYVGLYVTIAIFITFIVTLIAIALIRGPQGPFKTKRTNDDVERSEGARAEMVTVGASGDGADADLAAHTDAQWEQQPLKSDCDHSEAPEVTATTTVVNGDGGNSKEDGV
ncbi:uncharacterized protein [Diadema antillarum]|uniref:uncharacterized protein n=1 Tax=Diadema antillarum TaxID=105358 RepID=UPI003A8B36F6